MSLEDEDVLMKKVHAVGHWRVRFEPFKFVPDLVGDLRQCGDLINKSKVLLRGWDYPHIASPGPIAGADFVRSGSGGEDHPETWRYFQSGQFVHHFGCREDRPGGVDWYRHSEYSSKAGKYLSIVNVVWTTTEILLLASRLLGEGKLPEGVHLEIGLRGMKDRMLAFSEPGRTLNGPYSSDLDTVVFSQKVLAADLEKNPNRIAVDVSMYLFHRFNWLSAPRGLFEEDQKRLLERRF